MCERYIIRIGRYGSIETIIRNAEVICKFIPARGVPSFEELLNRCTAHELLSHVDYTRFQTAFKANSLRKLPMDENTIIAGEVSSLDFIEFLRMQLTTFVSSLIGVEYFVEELVSPFACIAKLLELGFQMHTPRKMCRIIEKDSLQLRACVARELPLGCDRYALTINCNIENFDIQQRKFVWHHFNELHRFSPITTLRTIIDSVSDRIAIYGLCEEKLMSILNDFDNLIDAIIEYIELVTKNQP